MLLTIILFKRSAYLIFLFLTVSCTSSPKKPDSTPQNKEPININSAVKNGEKEFYYPNGNLWSTSTYKDNIRHGKTTSYYENGQLRYLGFYNNGKKSGKWFFYNQDGTFAKEINYDSTKQNP